MDIGTRIGDIDVINMVMEKKETSNLSHQFTPEEILSMKQWCGRVNLRLNKIDELCRRHDIIQNFKNEDIECIRIHKI